MNSDVVTPKKFGHLHLVYHFTVPLNMFPKLPLGQIKKVMNFAV